MNRNLLMKIKTIRMHFSNNRYQSLSVLGEGLYKFGNTEITRKEFPKVIDFLIDDINKYVIKNTLGVLGDIITKGLMKISVWIERIVLLYNTEVNREKSVKNDSILYFFAVTNNMAMDELLNLLLKTTENKKLAYNIFFIIGELHNYYTPDISNFLIENLILNDKLNEEIRALIIQTLGKVKDQDAVLALIKTSEDDSWDVSFNSLWALGEIRSVNSLPTIISFLNHESEIMRGEAAIAIGKFGDEAHKEIINLLEILKSEDESTSVKQKILITLKNNKICESIPTILTIIKENKEKSLTKKSIETLGEISENCKNVEGAVSLLLDLYFNKKTEDSLKLPALTALSKLSPIPINELLQSYKPKESSQPVTVYQQTENTNVEAININGVLERKNRNLLLVVWIELGIFVLGILGDLIASIITMKAVWWMYGILFGIPTVILIVNIILRKKGII